MEWLSPAGLSWFIWPVILLLALLALELLGLLAGMGVFSGVDELLDGLDLADTSPLAWLMVGRVPILVLFALFVGGFAGTGVAVQSVAHSLSGAYLPQELVALLALPLGIGSMHFIGSRLGAYLYKGAQAPQLASVLGLTAVVEIGTARPDYPAQAKVVTPEGHTHLVMVEPELAGDEFPAGTRIVLAKQHPRQGRVFYGTRAVSAPRQIG